MGAWHCLCSCSRQILWRHRGRRDPNSRRGGGSERRHRQRAPPHRYRYHQCRQSSRIGARLMIGPLCLCWLCQSAVLYLCSIRLRHSDPKTAPGNNSHRLRQLRLTNSGASGADARRFVIRPSGRSPATPPRARSGQLGVRADDGPTGRRADGKRSAQILVFIQASARWPQSCQRAECSPRVASVARCAAA